MPPHGSLIGPQRVPGTIPAELVKHLTRMVGMAYRRGMIEGVGDTRSWRRAELACLTVWPDAPECLARRTIAILVSNAIAVDPKWFWRPVEAIIAEEERHAIGQRC